MSKIKCKTRDGAGVASISQNDVLVETDGINVGGNNPLGGPMFAQSLDCNKTFRPSREGMIRKLLSQKRRLTIDLKRS